MNESVDLFIHIKKTLKTLFSNPVNWFSQTLRPRRLYREGSDFADIVVVRVTDTVAVGGQPHGVELSVGVLLPVGDGGKVVIVTVVGTVVVYVTF